MSSATRLSACGIEDLPARAAVTARVRDETLPLCLRFHAADVAAAEPGWTRVELRFRSLLAAQPLLAFGPDVEVLTPDDLRDSLRRTAEATAALYRQSAPVPLTGQRPR
jgi:predicted DNA-binding transcriptional regulator YafY